MGVANTAMTGIEAKSSPLKGFRLLLAPLPPRIFKPSYGPATESMYIVNIFMLAEIKVNFTADKC